MSYSYINYKPSVKSIFDALTSDSSLDGCDPDWRASILDNASPKNIEKVRKALLNGETEAETAKRLGILP